MKADCAARQNVNGGRFQASSFECSRARAKATTERGVAGCCHCVSSLVAFVKELLRPNRQIKHVATMRENNRIAEVYDCFA
ncbi:hypothetical protein ACVIM9_002807 [Bradyrhizobium sp. USDA 4520]